MYRNHYCNNIVYNMSLNTDLNPCVYLEVLRSRNLSVDSVVAMATSGEGAGRGVMDTTGA